MSEHNSVYASFQLNIELESIKLFFLIHRNAATTALRTIEVDICSREKREVLIEVFGI